MSIVFADAVAFIWREADLLDRLDYQPWLDLWSKEGRYIIPINRDADDFEAVLNIVYDDAVMRAARVKRLLSGFSSSAAPPARTVRTVSRFVEQPSADAKSMVISAAQILTEYKYERLRIVPADVTFEIILHDGELRLHRKVVKLINSDDAQQGIGYLL